MKQTIQLGALSLANLLGLFLFQWYVISQLGPGVKTDAFFASTTLTQVVIAVIGGSLMHVLVPLLAGEEEESLLRDAWGFLVLVGGLFGLLAVVIYMAAPFLIPVILPGFDHDTQLLTVYLTRIQLIGMIFAAFNGVQWATYHARQRFVWAESTPAIASTLSLMMLILLLPRYGVVCAAWITVAGMALQTLLLAPGMGRPVRPDLKSIAIHQAWARIKPLLLGNGFYKTGPFVDRFLLSSANSGSLSLYYLVQQIYGGSCQLLNRAISAPLVPALSKLFKAGDTAGFRKLYYRKLFQLSVISCAGLLVVVLLGQTILGLLIGYGSINSGNILNLWWIMIWLGGVLIGGAAGQVCASTFYACGDTITPTRMSIINYCVFIPSEVVSFHFWGLMGMALATSVYYMANLLMQMQLLEVKFRKFLSTPIGNP